MLKHLREYINFNDYDIDETYDSPLTDKEFVKFLRDNFIYDKFINNLDSAIITNDHYYGRYWYSINTFCNDITSKFDLERCDYIKYAFVWSGTPEGRTFWANWHYRWFTKAM